MNAFLRVVGSLLLAMLVGVAAGIVLFAVADLTGLMGEIQREVPLPRFGRRLPFAGLAVLGGILGLFVGLLVQIARIRD